MTRWTFFRVKLVFEYDFEIYWSFRPWDHGSFGHLDLSILNHGTHGLQDFGTSSLLCHLLILPLASSYLFILLFLTSYTLQLFGMVWFGMVWYGLVWFGMVWFGLVWYGGGSDDD